MTLFTDQQMFSEVFDRHFANNDNDKRLERIAHFEAVIASRKAGFEDQERAYLALAYDATEYAERRNALKSQIAVLERELALTRSLLLTADEIEARKQEVLTGIAQIRAANGDLTDTPFEAKRRIVKLVICQIRLDANNKIAEIEGVVRGVFVLSSESLAIHGTLDENTTAFGA